MERKFFWRPEGKGAVFAPFLSRMSVLGSLYASCLQVPRFLMYLEVSLYWLGNRLQQGVLQGNDEKTKSPLGIISHWCYSLE